MGLVSVMGLVMVMVLVMGLVLMMVLVIVMNLRDKMIANIIFFLEMPYVVPFRKGFEGFSYFVRPEV